MYQFSLLSYAVGCLFVPYLHQFLPIMLIFFDGLLISSAQSPETRPAQSPEIPPAKSPATLPAKSPAKSLAKSPAPNEQPGARPECDRATPNDSKYWSHDF